MWFQSNKIANECEAVRDAMERTSGGDAVESEAARLAVLASLSDRLRNHLNACDDCRIFADELLQVREILRGAPYGPQPGPFFLARVMASIAGRESELEAKTQTWAAVPRLAYRLSVLASLLLLIAGSWLYRSPAPQTIVAAVSSEQFSEGLVEGSNIPAQDDALLNLADR